MQLYSNSIGLSLPATSDLVPGQSGLTWGIYERPETGLPASATNPPKTLNRSFSPWDTFPIGSQLSHQGIK